MKLAILDEKGLLPLLQPVILRGLLLRPYWTENECTAREKEQGRTGDARHSLAVYMPTHHI